MRTCTVSLLPRPVWSDCGPKVILADRKCHFALVGRVAESGFLGAFNVRAVDLDPDDIQAVVQRRGEQPEFNRGKHGLRGCRYNLWSRTGGVQPFEELHLILRRERVNVAENECADLHCRE